MTSIRTNSRWAVGLALAAACAIAATAQTQQATPVAAPVVDDIPFAAPDAAFVTVPSATEAWGGERTGNEATLSDRVVDYKIAATLDPKKHTVTGQQQLTWRNRSDRPIKAVYLHLYLNAFEGPGSTFYAEQREFNDGFRSGVEVDEGGFGYMRLTKVQQAGATAVSYTHLTLPTTERV